MRTLECRSLKQWYWGLFQLNNSKTGQRTAFLQRTLISFIQAWKKLPSTDVQLHTTHGSFTSNTAVEIKPKCGKFIMVLIPRPNYRTSGTDWHTTLVYQTFILGSIMSSVKHTYTTTIGSILTTVLCHSWLAIDWVWHILLELAVSIYVAVRYWGRLF